MKATAASKTAHRTRYIDDLLESTVHQGIQQVIILGAADYRQRHMPEKGYEFYRVAMAANSILSFHS